MTVSSIIFALFAIWSSAEALKCYSARITITQAGQSEELPLDAQIESGCTSCQRMKVVTESGSMPITMVTWSCEIPRPIALPVCPGQTTPPLPSTTTPKPDAVPTVCSEMVSRTTLTSPVKTTSQMCLCCHDNCNRSPGCQLNFQDLTGAKATNNSASASTTTPFAPQSASTWATTNLSSSVTTAMMTLADLIATTQVEPKSKFDLESRKIATRCDALRLAVDIVADVCGGESGTIDDGVTTTAKLIQLKNHRIH